MTEQSDTGLRDNGDSAERLLNYAFDAGAYSSGNIWLGAEYGRVEILPSTDQKVMIVHNTAPLFYLTGAVLLGMGILYGRLARLLFWALGSLTTLLSGWAFFSFPTHPCPPPALVVFVLGWALAIILPQRPRLWGVALVSASGAVLIVTTYQAWAFVEMWPLLPWYGIAGLAALTSSSVIALKLTLQRDRAVTD